MRTRRFKINKTNRCKPSSELLFIKNRSFNRRRVRASEPVHTSVRFDFNSLDEDILCVIFAFIYFKQLAKISCVSTAFNNMYSQHLHWKNLYLKTFSDNKETVNNWKQIYVEKLKELKKNKLNTFFSKILCRSKINYTLPNTLKLLNALNIEYIFYINNIFIPHDKQYINSKFKRKHIRIFNICNVLKIENYELLSKLSLKQIKNIKIKIKSNKLFEAIELNFDIHFSQMRILKNIDINNKNKKNNNIINLYSHKNIHFAVYNDTNDDNISFIVISLNHYNLLSAICSKLFQFDKISYIGKDNNNNNNFYGWKCEIMFRNLKKIFYHSKFYEIIPINKCNQLTQFKLLGDTNIDYDKIDRFPIYPWKSQTFKGKENGIFEIDIVLLNDKNHILFAKSIMLNCVSINDLYNFTDQSNNDKRYLFTYKNVNQYEIFNMLTGNIIVLDKLSNYCNIQKLFIYLNLNL